MKYIYYSVLFVFGLLLFSSCEEDDTLPSPANGFEGRSTKFGDLGKGGFVVFEDLDVWPQAVSFENPQGLSVSRTLIDPNDNIQGMDIRVIYTRQGSLDTATIEGLRTPYVLTMNPENVQQWTGSPIDDFAFGDFFRFEPIITTNDGEVFSISNTTNNLLGPGIAGAMSFQMFFSCPFNADDAVGEWLITRDDFETTLDIERPITCERVSDTEIRFVNLFSHPEMFDVNIVVDIATAQATVTRQPAWHCDNFGCAFGEGRVNGGGFVFSCVGFVQLDLQHTVDAGSFGTFRLELQKQ